MPQLTIKNKNLPCRKQPSPIQVDTGAYQRQIDTGSLEPVYGQRSIDTKRALVDSGQGNGDSTKNEPQLLDYLTVIGWLSPLSISKS